MTSRETESVTESQDSVDDHLEQQRWVRAVVAEYEGRLLRYATQVTGDVERARDVVQEAFLRLCRQPKTEVEDHLAPWLYTVCRNLALDVRRKESRMRSITPEHSAEQPSNEADHTAAAEQRDTTQHILRLVDSLTDNQREVVRLKFQDGLSYREISRITELSVSNVGYLIHTAIRRLREQLAGEISV
jgi:RNA polymerase sigma-70 factor (ECF subfamily)